MVCGDAELDMRALLSLAGVGYRVTWCYLYKQAWYTGLASDPTVGLAAKTVRPELFLEMQDILLAFDVPT